MPPDFLDASLCIWVISFADMHLHAYISERSYQYPLAGLVVAFWRFSLLLFNYSSLLALILRYTS